MKRSAKWLLLWAVLSGALSACAADELDCSLGAMKPSCPPGTVGFDRMAERLRLAQRLCLQKGLQSGSDAYAACLLAEGPVRPLAHTGAFDHLGP